jgi:hypothetical protein
MTVAEIIAELDDHGFTDETSTTKVRVIQHTIWDLEGRSPWPWIETSINLAYDGSSGLATNFPADFRAAVKVKDLSTGRKLRPLDIDEFEDMVGNNYTQTGAPAVYYFEGTSFNVWPVPGAPAPGTGQTLKDVPSK